jgi:hypothetical protein
LIINKNLKENCAKAISFPLLLAFFNKNLSNVMNGYESNFSIPINSSYHLTYDLLFNDILEWELGFDGKSSGEALVAYKCNDTIIETREEDDGFAVAVSLVLLSSNLILNYILMMMIGHCLLLIFLT